MRRTVSGLVAVGALAALAAGLLGLPAFAEGYVDASDTPAVVAGQEVDGAAFLAGNSVTVAGTVKGDLFCAGNTITITGVVEGDVLCAGNTVTVVGRVGGDVRVGGNSVTMSGNAGGAVTAGGNSVILAQGSVVTTDLTAGAATLTLAGSVGRDVRFGAGAATMSGEVGRDVDAEVDSLTVTDAATIGGHLHYVSSRDAAVAAGAVQGEVRRTDPPAEDARTFPPQTRPAPTAGQWILGALGRVVGLVLLTLAVTLLLPRFVRRTTATSWAGLGKAALAGLLAIAAGLPVIVILFLTIVGAGAGLLLLVAYPLALVLAAPLTAYFIGRELLRQRTANMFLIAAAGAGVLGVASVVPFVGALVGFAAACAGVGLIVLGLRGQYLAPAYVDPAAHPNQPVPQAPPYFPQAPAQFPPAPPPGPQAPPPAPPA